VDTALAIGAGGDHLSVPQFGKGGGQGKQLAFQVVIVGKTVRTSGGVEDPVSDIDQVQKPAEFPGCQFDLHKEPPKGAAIQYIRFFRNFQMETGIIILE
jgi:hypothetical protein